MYVLKDLFGILVIVSVDAKNHWWDLNWWDLNYENCKCRRKLVDKLVEVCAENFEEVKLAKIISAEEGKNQLKCISCTL